MNWAFTREEPKQPPVKSIQLDVTPDELKIIKHALGFYPFGRANEVLPAPHGEKLTNALYVEASKIFREIK